MEFSSLPLDIFTGHSANIRPGKSVTYHAYVYRLKLERNRDPRCLSLKGETSTQPVQVKHQVRGSIMSLTSDHCTNEIIPDRVQIVRLILRYVTNQTEICLT